MNLPEGEHNNNSTESVQPISTQNKNKPQIISTDIGESNSLDKVRDILFGNQMREVEKRITRIEERLVRECTNLRDDTRKRLDSLEMYIKKEVDALTERLKTEQTGRDEAVKLLAESHQSLTLSLEKMLTQIEEKNTQSQKELREQILNQSKNLYDDIQQKSAEILVLLEKESQELRFEKTNRSTLANLFAELAVRLNEEK